MTPSNPNNQQPLIYRIADALGITHLVVAVQHSHLMSEIEGLVSALAGKSDTSHSHKIIQYNPSASTDGFAGFPTTGNGDFVVGVQDNKNIIFQFGGMPKASVTKINADNLARALQDPDTTPTADSDNLVTSGGVKTALNQKANASHTHTQIGNDNYGIIALSGDADGGYVYVSLHQTSGPDVEFFLNKTALENVFEPDTTPTTGSSKLVTSGGVASAIKSATSVLFVNGVLDLRNLEKDRLYTVIIKNNTGETAIADDFIDASLLPSGEDNVYFNTPMSIEVANGEEFGVRLIRTSSGCYGCYDGKFEY